MWPLLKKQLHQSKVMRDLQPELTKIKKAAGGDKQQEGRMMMELYKEKGISPFGTIGLTLVQLPLFIGVFQAARDLTEHLDKIGTFTYPFVRNIPHIQTVIENKDNFNFVSLGFIDLSQRAISNGSIYFPVMVLAVAATVFQYIQSKQLIPQPKEKKKLRDLLRSSATTGKQPDQEDMSAAMSSSMLFLMPILTMLFAVAAQGAMVVYLLASSVIGIFQQTLIFRKDTTEMEAEVEVVSVKKTPESKSSAKQEVVSAAPEQKINKGKVVTKTRIISPSSTPAQQHSSKKSKKRKKR
jgi:YidC/Oxa1 family membrane protein insertase